jgi:hypothetical protein
MKISEFQRAADVTDESAKAAWVGFNQNLLGLIEKVGGISGAMKMRLRDRGSYSRITFRTDVERCIGETLWYLSAVATHFHSDLEAIAEKNLIENRKRWGGHRDEQGKLFHRRTSERFPAEEQFPDKIVVEFTNVEGPNQVSWLSTAGVSVNGKPFGDPIDDNSPSDDGYRFHDILHFAFAAYLDWSPVVRKLMGNKRKSNPKTDKYDDGARAGDTEEAVSNLIHRTAKAAGLFNQATHVPTDFLNEIMAQVCDLEVRDREAKEWERCILAAYEVFRELKNNNGGVVDVYFDDPRLIYRPH